LNDAEKNIESAFLAFISELEPEVIKVVHKEKNK
jgi:hypothetical protein